MNDHIKNILSVDAIKSQLEDVKLEKHDENLETLIEVQKKPITRVTNAGGGAKGVQYVGALWGMVDTGVFKTVDSVAGSSAGAICSAFQACGMEISQFRDLFLTTNFGALMGEKLPTKHSLPKESVVPHFTKTGDPVLQMVRSGIAKSLEWLLEDKDSEGAYIDLNVISDDDPTFKQRIESGRITFGDLKLLQASYPHHFKSLTMLAVEYPSGEPQVFDAEKTKDVEIALACRASASLPVILAPVEIEVNGDKKIYMDGGFYDNVPVDYFDKAENDIQKNTKPKETLVFAFGKKADPQKNPISKALYGTRIEESLAENFSNLLSEKLLNMIQADLEDKKALITRSSLEENIFNLLKNPPYEVEGELLEQDEEHLKKIAALIADKISQLLKDENLQNKLKHARDNNPQKLAGIIEEFIVEKIVPAFYEADFFAVLTGDIAVKYAVKLCASYKHTDRTAEIYKKLHRDYPLRTVELRVEGLQTTDFKIAGRYGRVFSSLSYLNTVMHAINYAYYDTKTFNEETFCDEIINGFEAVYRALAETQKFSANTEKLMTRLNKLKSNNASLEQKLELIQDLKDYIEKNPNSNEAFAISRFLEYRAGFITKNQLLQEVYEEAFYQKGFFATSNLFGKTIYTRKGLRKVMDENSENLEEIMEKHEGHRTKKIFDNIKNLQVTTKALSPNNNVLAEDEEESEGEGEGFHP